MHYAQYVCNVFILSYGHFQNMKFGVVHCSMCWYAMYVFSIVFSMCILYCKFRVNAHPGLNAYPGVNAHPGIKVPPPPPQQHQYRKSKTVKCAVVIASVRDAYSTQHTAYSIQHTAYSIQRAFDRKIDHRLRCARDCVNALQRDDS